MKDIPQHMALFVDKCLNTILELSIKIERAEKEEREKREQSLSRKRSETGEAWTSVKRKAPVGKVQMEQRDGETQRELTLQDLGSVPMKKTVCVGEQLKGGREPTTPPVTMSFSTTGGEGDKKSNAGPSI